MALEYAVAHILALLATHRTNHESNICPPLFIGIQGPQGSGKTHIARELTCTLHEKNIILVSLSLDDFYYPHEKLASIAASYPHNPLLAGRGLPATHDVALGLQILNALQRVNNDMDTQIRLPAYDKSAHGGRGDRMQEGAWPQVKGPIDIVLLEGWCVGFYPVNAVNLLDRWQNGVESVEPSMVDGDDTATGTWMSRRGIQLENIELANKELREYVHLWEFCDGFLQLTAPAETPYTPIYAWRLQQEHAMKLKNGGFGMNDEEVNRFVDRYVPGYHFFGDGVRTGWVSDSMAQASPSIKNPRWKGKGLSILIGPSREVISTKRF